MEFLDNVIILSWIHDSFDFVSNLLLNISFGGVSLAYILLGICVISCVARFILAPFLSGAKAGGSDKVSRKGSKSRKVDSEE